MFSYIKVIELVALVGLAVISDWRYCKIRNSHLSVFLVLGLLGNLLFDMRNIPSYAVGTIAPVALLFPLFMLRMLGAGDIKLFSVIGSITGMAEVIQVMVFSFLAGGVMAIGFMIYKKNLPGRFKCLAIYIKSCILTASLLQYSGDDKKGWDGKFPFAAGIALGTGVYLVRLISF